MWGLFPHKGLGMKENAYFFERLASREEFNASVRHIKSTIGILDGFVAKENLADAIGELLEEKAISQDDVLSIVHMVLCDKYPYVCRTANLSKTNNECAKLANEVCKWSGLDVLVLYHHPDMGIMALNPKNKAHMASVDRFSKNECVSVYAGAFSKEYDKARMAKACDTIVAMIEGDSPKVDPSFLKGACAYKQPSPAVQPAKRPTVARAKAPKAAAKGSPAFQAPNGGIKVPSFQPSAAVGASPTQGAAAVVVQAAPAVSSAAGPVKMTPLYGVPVTNELFHNGNVEAWKRIIESYTTKYPRLQVFVYYDGERITDLNSLFKWGKVKRGTCIEFKVVGENVVDVAKLQRYLRQGASQMFEAFLKFPVNSVVPLF